MLDSNRMQTENKNLLIVEKKKPDRSRKKQNVGIVLIQFYVNLMTVMKMMI